MFCLHEFMYTLCVVFVVLMEVKVGIGSPGLKLQIAVSFHLHLGVCKDYKSS